VVHPVGMRGAQPSTPRGMRGTQPCTPVGYERYPCCTPVGYERYSCCTPVGMMDTWVCTPVGYEGHLGIYTRVWERCTSWYIPPPGMGEVYHPGYIHYLHTLGIPASCRTLSLRPAGLLHERCAGR